MLSCVHHYRGSIIQGSFDLFISFFFFATVLVKCYGCKVGKDELLIVFLSCMNLVIIEVATYKQVLQLVH